MAYYFFIRDNKINGVGQCECLNEEIQNIETTEEIFNSYIEDPLRYAWNGEEIIDNPNYEQEAQQRRREKLDQLTLTPADVERALYRAKDMDFEDLKALIAERMPNIDIKGLAIEFRAKDFYRGATAGHLRLFDAIGQLLGYTSEDMDYLFQNGTLPEND